MTTTRSLIPLNTPPKIRESAHQYAVCLRRLKRELQQMPWRELIHLGILCHTEFPEPYVSRSVSGTNRRRLKNLLPDAVDRRLMRKMDRSNSSLFLHWESIEQLKRILNTV